MKKVACGSAFLHSPYCLGGKTSLPNATVRRYLGGFFSSTPNEEIIVSAETTQQTVLMRCSLRKSHSFMGNKKSVLGTK